MCREAVVAFFEVASGDLRIGTEHIHNTWTTVATYSDGPKFECVSFTCTVGLRPSLGHDIRCMAQIPWLSSLLATVFWNLNYILNAVALLELLRLLQTYDALSQTQNIQQQLF